MSNKKLHFETLQLHVGQENPDPATDARAVPIYILRSLCHPLLLNFIQCLLDIIQNIFDILDTY